MNHPIPLAPAADSAAWMVSSYSGGGGGNCVEVGPAEHVVGVRDTKNRDRGALIVAPGTWSAFVADVRRGKL